MIWWKQSRPSPALRRRILGMECLENRFAPASLGSLGQVLSDAAPAATLLSDSSINTIAQFVSNQLAAPVSIIVAGADAPIGFFHRFCQNGFVSGETIAIETAPPRPRAVQPPVLAPAAAAQAAPLAAPEIRATPIPVMPPEPVTPPPASVEAPAPLPTLLDVIPAAFSRSAAPGAFEEESEPVVIDGRLASAVFASDSDAITPAASSSRVGLATLCGLFAATGLLYTRNSRERRYEDMLTFGR